MHLGLRSTIKRLLISYDRYIIYYLNMVSKILIWDWKNIYLLCIVLREGTIIYLWVNLCRNESLINLNLQVNKIEESIDFIKSRPKALAIYAFTSNQTLKRRLISETSSGSVTFNDTIIQVNSCTSFYYYIYIFKKNIGVKCVTSRYIQ